MTDKFESGIDKVSITSSGGQVATTPSIGDNENLTIRIWLDVDGMIEHVSPQWAFFGQVNVNVIQPIKITHTTTEEYKNLCDCSEETVRHTHRTWTTAFFPGTHWAGYEFFKCVKSVFGGKKNGK